MTSVLERATDHAAVSKEEVVAADAADLARFGYAQQLRRRLGAYSSFAAGFSFVSILTTVVEFFGFGFGFGGPAFFWTWPLVFVGQFLVALCFAELASHYPIAGCIYQWSRRLAGGIAGWFSGWMMLLGQVVSVAAAAIALQETLPMVWKGFQLVGSDTSITSTSGATNAVILGSLLIVATTIVNLVGVNVMAVINDVGVTCELVGVTVLVTALFVHANRGPGVVFHTNGVQGHGSYLWPFLISTLMACYVMYGFDSAGELAEETRRPRHTAPHAIIRALATSGVGGALLLISALVAAGSITDPKLGSVGLPYVITSRLGPTFGKVILLDVSVAISVCTLAIQTAGSRMMFSLARDRVLPFGSVLGRVSSRTGTPVLPPVLIGLLAVGVLLINVGQAQLFAALGSVAVVIVYLAYLGVTLPLLVRRLRGWPGGLDAGQRRFSLGRWGIVVNLAAVCWGIFTCVNIAWPRAVVYDPNGGHWYLQYFAPIFVVCAVLLGALAYRSTRNEGHRRELAEVRSSLETAG